MINKEEEQFDLTTQEGIDAFNRRPSQYKPGPFEIVRIWNKFTQPKCKKCGSRTCYTNRKGSSKEVRCCDESVIDFSSDFYYPKWYNWISENIVLRLVLFFTNPIDEYIRKRYNKTYYESSAFTTALLSVPYGIILLSSWIFFSPYWAFKRTW